MQPSTPYSDPDVLARVADLAVRVHGLVDGLRGGLHQSPFQGAAIEFASFREYVPGEDPRRLDWRVLGRTDRPYIKLHEQESNLRAVFVVDASGSMGYSGSPTRLSKYDYAATLVAALAMVLLDQQDSVGLARLTDDLDSWLPVGSAADQRTALLDHLGRGVARGKDTDLGTVLPRIPSPAGRRGLTIVISDFLTDPDRLNESLALVRARGEHMICLQLLDPDERTLPFDEPTLFIDLESDSEMLVDPQIVRDEYRQAMAQFIADRAADCQRLGIEHVLTTTDEHPGVALRELLARRGRLRFRR